MLLQASVFVIRYIHKIIAWTYGFADRMWIGVLFHFWHRPEAPVSSLSRPCHPRWQGLALQDKELWRMPIALVINLV